LTKLNNIYVYVYISILKRRMGIYEFALLTKSFHSPGLPEWWMIETVWAERVALAFGSS
jgi:hypothetical protein